MLPENDDDPQVEEIVEGAEAKTDDSPTPEETEHEAAGEGSGEEGEGKEKPKPKQSELAKGFERYRKSSGRRIAHYERENQQLRSELDRLAGRVDQIGRSSPEATRSEEGPPDPAKFGDDYSAYLEAVADYKVRQRLGGVLGQLKEGQKQAREQQSQQQRQEGLTKKFEGIYRAGKAEIDDFEDIRSVEFPASDTVLDAIPEGALGARVIHFLANDPDEAERIMGLSDMGQVRAVGRLEERLEKLGKKRTEAKKPVKPEGGGTGAGATNEDKLSDDEWYRRWQAKEAKRRSG